MRNKLKVIVAASMAVFLNTGLAYAVTVNPVATVDVAPCTDIDVSIGGKSYDSCFNEAGDQDFPDAGGKDGVDNTSLLENLNAPTSIFGDLGVFQIIGKNDTGSNFGEVDLDETSGSFNFTIVSAFSSFVVSLKSANGYFGFLFEGGAAADTYAGLFSSMPQDLSHITYAGVPGTPGGGGGLDGVVPLPAGLPLIMTALGVLGVLRMRKSDKAA